MPIGIDTIFPYMPPRGITEGKIEHMPVIIVGAGPVGLAAAVDLALHGVKSVLIDDNNRLSVGSRAICWAKRTLEIFDRLGIGDRMLGKGITWKVGRAFHRDKEVYSMDLLPERNHKMPAFVNLQQYYVEHYLVERARDFPDLIEIRWNNKLTGISQSADGVIAIVTTPDGAYQLGGDYLIACDGASSTTRSLLGLKLEGQTFDEHFLIADVVMKADFPSERWFWFDPPFHPNHSALLHKQPDNLYRIDFQFGRDVDPQEEKRPEKVIPRIEAMIGHSDFELDWLSMYSFQCSRLPKFVHDRVIFAGDSAHVVSPFGARGGNGGIQDIDNLVWKLAAVLNAEAPSSMLDTYDEERVPAADENALASSRTTRFIAPATQMEKALRNSVLKLAENHPFARKLVNSGRMSVPHNLSGYSLQTPDNGAGLGSGTPCPDAPLRNGWLLNELGGAFSVLCVGHKPAAEIALPHVMTSDPIAIERYGADMTFLVRPDQHIAASFSSYDKSKLQAAHRRALGRLQ